MGVYPITGINIALKRSLLGKKTFFLFPIIFDLRIELLLLKYVSLFWFRFHVFDDLD